MDKDSTIGEAISRTYDLMCASNYSMAEALCRQVLLLDGENDTAWFLLGSCLYAQGNVEATEDALEKAVRHAKKSENKQTALKLLWNIKGKR